MKKTALAIVMIGGLGLAGCNSTNPNDRALVGGALGAATGATIAAAAGANTGATLAIAGASGIAGAAVGAATTPTQRCVNQFGDPVPCP